MIGESHKEVGVTWQCLLDVGAIHVASAGRPTMFIAASSGKAKNRRQALPTHCLVPTSQPPVSCARRNVGWRGALRSVW